MTYLSRELIRRMIIAEARKKAPLLPGGGFDFDNEDTEPLTGDLTALDMSRVELTQPLDIDTDTKIEDVPAPVPTPHPQSQGPQMAHRAKIGKVQK